MSIENEKKYRNKGKNNQMDFRVAETNQKDFSVAETNQKDFSLVEVSLITTCQLV